MSVEHASDVAVLSVAGYIVGLAKDAVSVFWGLWQLHRTEQRLRPNVGVSFGPCVGVLLGICVTVLTATFEAMSP